MEEDSESVRLRGEDCGPVRVQEKIDTHDDFSLAALFRGVSLVTASAPMPLRQRGEAERGRDSVQRRCGVGDSDVMRPFVPVLHK